VARVARVDVKASDGFTIIETTVALSVLMIVLTGLAGTVTVSVRGVVLGRQRTGGVAVANEVIETARGRAYEQVGHDFTGDATLATDPALTGSAPNTTFNGEPLAASIVAGSNAPFSPHTWTTTRDATTYTVSVYVTTVTPAAGTGDAYKRITVSVAWGNAQFGLSAGRSVTLSSFMYPALQPPDPLLVSTTDADAGTLTLTGTLNGISLHDAHLWFPFSHGELQSRFIRTARGSGQTAHSQLKLDSGVATGCSLSNGNSTADCTGVKANSLADDDAGTPPLDYDKQNVSDGSHTVSAGSALNVV